MLEAAVLYISIAIGKKLLDHAGDDAGDAFDKSLGRLAQWVKQTVTTRRPGKVAVEMIESEPEGNAGHKMLTAVLADITEDPAAASQLRDLVANAERSDPDGGANIVRTSVNVDEAIRTAVIGALSRNAPPGSRSETTVTVKSAKDSWIIGNANLH
jgi:hypothetical protein